MSGDRPGGSTADVEGAMTRPPDEDAPWQPSAAPFVFWAVLLGGLSALQAGFGGRSLPVLVQAGAAAATGLIGIVILISPRVIRRRAAGLRTVPDLSLASALVGISLAAMLAGASVGSWLILGGFLGVAAGTGGLVREHRFERRTRVASLEGRSENASEIEP
ncbi:MAG TPA: hypothetical protein VIJ51_08500 [Solirubrobacteraceae bacterium]